MKLDLSPESVGRVVVSTIVGTTVCVAVALYVDSFNFAQFNDAERLRAIIVDICLPIALAVPLLLFFSNKLRELAIAHRRLAVFAATDALTDIMNRAAFSTLVEAYLSEVRSAEAQRSGALLIIDVDNFKSVNDRFGHDQGDVALVTVAHTIRDLVRSPDIVGRIGGEEFGVFLPGASLGDAETVAERIRRSVDEARFVPTGTPHHLTVSVGGAVFDHQLAFQELFRTADQQLYVAKRDGRNRTVIGPAPMNSNRKLAAA
ncbi:MAG: GGDEF domain-containing protein [Devosia sp.]